MPVSKHSGGKVQEAHSTQGQVRIAIVEDDADQLDYLRLCLGADYLCSGYRDASAFIRSLAQSVPDVLLLDWNLPDISGIELLRQLRRQGHQILAMVITARNDETSLVSAFEAGANDFIGKPVRPGELKARVQALARRVVPPATSDHYRVGAYRVDLQARSLFINDEAVRLTNREFDLAVLLLQRIGELLHRDVLLRSVWGLDESIGTRTLDTHVSRLRKKLGLNGDFGFQLRSVYQLGYRLEKQS
ncbi:hypothetical protein AN401_17010 [Zobellella denitrificans]|uniref:DNA-binding response regulator n=1 Tax=Zobellella denitrificans TaxID=347534 RepID=A0A291HV57_9GAMM|nr:hypothetical protein AN401_17010 [Zobellella denitrificans]